MSAGTRTPVDAHVSGVAARLSGPARLRADLLAEVRAGLDDAACAHQRRGACAEDAQRRAVEEFGAVDDVAPAFQEQLAVAQARATARLLLLAFPGLLLGWDLVWSSGAAWSEPAPVVLVLARVQDAVSVGAGVAAVVALVLLARGARRPGGSRRTVLAVGVLGAVAAVASGATAVVMNVVGGGAADLLAREPLTAVPYAVSAAALVLVLRSVARTLALAAR